MTPDIYLYEMIQLSDCGHYRSRVWQWFQEGRLVKRTLIDEQFVSKIGGRMRQKPQATPRWPVFNLTKLRATMTFKNLFIEHERTPEVEEWIKEEVADQEGAISDY